LNNLFKKMLLLDLPDYLDEIIISDKLIDSSKKEVDDIIPILKERKIPYMFKTWHTYW